MRRILLTICAVTLCFVGIGEEKENNNQPVEQIQIEVQQLNNQMQTFSGPRVPSKPLPEGDVLKQVKEINKKGAPTTTYRKGHVSNHSLSDKSVKTSVEGFTVDLPGNFPIPTPVVYKDKIYVSGGFGSKKSHVQILATRNCAIIIKDSNFAVIAKIG